MKKVDKLGGKKKDKNEPMDEVNETLFNILNKRKNVSATHNQKFGKQRLGKKEVPKRK